MNLTKELEKRCKGYPLYSQENEKDPLVLAKLFEVSGSASWYITEYDPESQRAFSYVTGFYEDEWGYSYIPEMEAIKHPALGIPGIEVDLYFEPRPFSECIQKA